MIINKIKIDQLKILKEKERAAFKLAGINYLADFLNFFPIRYIDHSSFISIKEFGYHENLKVNFKARLINKIEKTLKNKRKMLLASFSDGSGFVKCNWFHYTGYYKQQLKIGEEYFLYGTVSYFNGWQITHPEFESVKNLNKDSMAGKIIPVYSQNKIFMNAKINNNRLRAIIRSIFETEELKFTEILPANILKSEDLLEIQQAYQEIHQPTSTENQKKAIYRFKFSELFYLQLIFELRKQTLSQNKSHFAINHKSELIKKLYNSLPFDLTNAQKRVIKEIYSDLKNQKILNRLLQGDVGSGKTIVALMVILIMVESGYQAVIMAPTEILATQHYQEFAKLLAPFKINISFLKGKMRKKLRDEILQNISGGITQIVVGTHALFQDDIVFHNLALVIIDEQHRFGVLQRKKLADKARFDPHLLVMTATPIPRTITLSYYGDLDVSIIDELPKGRQKIRTAIRMDKDLTNIYSFIRTQVEEKKQIYIVYPLIEENETTKLKSAVKEYEKLINSYFSDLRVGLIHGKLAQEDKDSIMEKFANQEIDILISTTVIEVGVNVPNATVMLIMHSERFGLAQLHQLRGRVGRGSQQSYCILHLGKDENQETLNRLKILENENDGFKISEEDFKLRGPGHFFGESQSGHTDLKLVNLLYDRKILFHAKKIAHELLQNDLFLENQPLLRAYMNQNYQDKISFLDIS